MRQNKLSGKFAQYKKLKVSENEKLAIVIGPKCVKVSFGSTVVCVRLSSLLHETGILLLSYWWKIVFFQILNALVDKYCLKSHLVLDAL